jgi:hypothetical protein
VHRDQLGRLTDDDCTALLAFVATLIGASSVSHRRSDEPMPVCQIWGDEWPIGDITSALDIIPSYTDYESWMRIGAAVFDATSGTGFQAFDEWSSKCPEYSERATDGLWRGFYRNPLFLITAGTLVHHARLADPDWDRPSIAGFVTLRILAKVTQ